MVAQKLSFGKIRIHHHLLLAGVLRAALVAFGEWQDRNFQVKYTDIDYHIISDGATYVSQGLSPFLRETYRYTPLLAVLLVPNVFVHPVFGKMIFLVADVLVGLYIYRVVKAVKMSERKAVLCAALWLYNPMTLTISTRGSWDSVLSLLVLFVVYAVLKTRDIAAGLAYGFSVHCKMYTAIYALPLYLSLQPKHSTPKQEQQPETWLKTVLPNKRRAQFCVAAAIGLLLPSFLCFVTYGNKFLQEVFFHHLTRKDFRHNFSPFFYLLYLDQGGAFLAFVPQTVLMTIISIKYSRVNDLPFCLFCETYIFVAFNKVCTSQYFLWYLCLLPAALPKLNVTLRNGFLLLAMWAGGQALWLAEAYYLEFEGKPLFLNVWVASLIFLVVNTFILCFVMFSYSSQSQRSKKQKQK